MRENGVILMKLNEVVANSHETSGAGTHAEIKWV